MSATMKLVNVEETLFRMRRRLQASAWALCMLMGLQLSLSPSALAANIGPGNLDLQVTFNGSLSVLVDGQTYSTRTFNAGSNALVVPSSATVTNNSTGLTETWQLSVSTVSGGGNWSVLGSTQTPPDIDEFAFQALFTSSATSLANEPGTWNNGCPAPNASDWDMNASTVTGAAAAYTSKMYADPITIAGVSGNPDATSGASNGNMFPAPTGTDGRGIRGLCTRIYMPSGTEVVNAPQVIRLTITAAPGH